MPTSRYHLMDGKRVPSVTTIIGRFKESGALIAWANKVGLEGKNFRDLRDSAADAGTLCHDHIEQYHRHGRKGDETPYTPEQRLLADQGFESYLEWYEGTSLKLEASLQEQHLVSEAFRYGGTPDAVGKDGKGRWCLLDWKTSNGGPYVDWIVQLAAYINLLEENSVCGEIERIHSVRIGKEDASFHHASWPRSSMDAAWQYFRSARRMYDLDKRLKKQV